MQKRIFLPLLFITIVNLYAMDAGKQSLATQTINNYSQNNPDIIIKNIVKGSKGVQRLERLAQAASLLYIQSEMATILEEANLSFQKLKEFQVAARINDKRVTGFACEMNNNTDEILLGKPQEVIDFATNKRIKNKYFCLINEHEAIACGLKFSKFFQSRLDISWQDLSYLEHLLFELSSRLQTKQAKWLIFYVLHCRYFMHFNRALYNLPFACTNLNQSSNHSQIIENPQLVFDGIDTSVVDEISQHTVLKKVTYITYQLVKRFREYRKTEEEADYSREFLECINDMGLLVMELKQQKPFYSMLYQKIKNEFDKSSGTKLEKIKAWRLPWILHNCSYDKNGKKINPTKDNSPITLPIDLSQQHESFEYSLLPLTNENAELLFQYMQQKLTGKLTKQIDINHILAPTLSKPTENKEKTALSQKNNQSNKKHSKSKKGRHKNNAAQSIFSLVDNLSREEQEGILQEPSENEQEIVSKMESMDIIASLKSETAPTSASSKAEAIVNSSPLPLEKSDVRDKHIYDQRVLNWFKDDIAEKEDVESVLYHSFSLLVDDYLFSKGHKELRPNASRPDQIDNCYKLAGSIIFKNGVRKHVIFHATKDPRGICYHRGIEWRDGDLFDLYIAPQFWEIKSGLNGMPLRNLDKTFKRASTQEDIIELDNTLLTQIRDNRLGITIILYNV